MKNPNHKLQYELMGFHCDNPDHHYDLVTEKYRCVVEESFSTPPSTWTPQGWRGQPGKVKVSLWEFCLFSLGTAVMWSMSSFHLHFYFLDVAIFLVFTFTFLNQMWLFFLYSLFFLRHSYFYCVHFHFSFWDVAILLCSLSLFFFRCGYFSFIHFHFSYSDVATFLLFTFTFLVQMWLLFLYSPFLEVASLL